MGLRVDCPICTNLERAYETARSNYVHACSSASYGVSTKLSAWKNVEMERARYELEEHRLICIAFKLRPLAPK